MRFIVTAIGSFSADCVINTLKSSNHYVVGCDIYDGHWHPVSKDCDVFYQVPYAIDENAYINSLLDISGKEYITHIIPLTDLEIDILNKYRGKFENKGIMLCMQSTECLSIARDKYNLCRMFENDAQVNIPRYIRSEELTNSMDLFFPLVAKPNKGRSSEGLFRIYSKEELHSFFDFTDYIIQEMIEGSVYTVDYVRDTVGNDFSVPREELLRTKNGAGTTVRILHDNVLSETVSYIGKKLGICGCVNMEFIFNVKKNKYFLIDINPRFSAGVAFTNLIGYDMVTSHVNCFMNKAILPPVTYEEQIVAKRYVEKVLYRKC